MPPPCAPPPRMRDLFVPPSEPPANPPPVLARPASTISSGSNESNRYVRPTSPEDVYDDRERMSYMSASVLNRDRLQQHQYAALPSHQADPYYQPHLSHQHHPSHSSSASIHSHSQSLRQNPSATPSTIVSRQTSNTSSNMTTGTTASGSENWETFSDGSEMEPERDVRDNYYSKVHTNTTNALGMSYNANGQRRPMATAREVLAGQMGPPPTKNQVNSFKTSQYGERQERFREMSDENAHPSVVRVEGSDAAWSTELEESY
jgi:Ase1/PRC1/MAP65 family protein